MTKKTIENQEKDREGNHEMEMNFCSCQATGWFFAHFIRLPHWWRTSLRAENALAPALRSPTPSNVILASFLCRLIICLSCTVAERVEMTQDGAVSAVICPNCIRQRRGRNTKGGAGGGFGRVCSFVIGSFVAKNLEILLTYKYVRVCLVSSVYASTWMSKWVCGCVCECVCGVQVLPS